MRRKTKTMIEITANTRRAIVTNKELLTTSSAGIQVQFTFSEDWDSLSRFAIFRNGEEGQEVAVALPNSNLVVIPAQSCSEDYVDEPVFVGMYGTDGLGAVIIPTIWTSLGVLRPGAVTTEIITPAEPTPDMWAQILAIANEAAAIADECEVNEELRVAAEQLRANAETARANAETLRAQAEVERSGNEAQRQSAETQRQTDENARAQAETLRVQAEELRQANETNRASAENTRASNERSRQSHELERDSAESLRGIREMERINAEWDRQSAETARASAETSRAGAESSRATAEQNRVSAETARASAESARATAESTRASNEQSRVSAETARAQAETDRATEFATWESTIASKVPNTRTINGKALSEDITLDSGDIGYDSTETYQSGTVGYEVAELTRQLNDLEPIVDQHSDELAWLLMQHVSNRDEYKAAMKMWFDAQGAAAMSAAGLTELCNKWYAATRDNWNGWTTFYQPDVSDVSTGVRGGDNENMVCVPSTNTVAGRDDFAALPLFACVDVNYDIDATTLDVVIIAIDGVAGNFERTNPDKLVGVMQMTGYVWTVEETETYTVGYSARYQSGKDECWPLPESIRPADNSVREFVVHTKYMGFWDGEKMCAIAGKIPTGYMALGTFQTRCKARGTGHGGGSVLLQSFLILMSYIKYASLTQDGINQGCSNYNYQYAAAVAETETSRILITPEQAENLKVGSGCFLGTVGASNGIDRTSNTTVYGISGQEGCIITGIEEVEIDGTTYAAITTDYDGTFDTTGDGTITTGNTLISTYAWPAGANDNILGNDGAIDDPGSGIYPAKIQGIEYATGQYETMGDVLLKYNNVATGYSYRWYSVHFCRRAAHQTTSVSANYINSGHGLTRSGGENWYYIEREKFHSGIAFPSDISGGSSTTLTKDAFYKLSTSSAASVRVFRAFGTLGSGSELAGLSCVIGHTVSSVFWTFAGRPSACANRGEWAA